MESRELRTVILEMSFQHEPVEAVATAVEDFVEAETERALQLREAGPATSVAAEAEAAIHEPRKAPKVRRK